MTVWPFLFNDETLSDVVDRRVAEAASARAEGADALIARLRLDVPVATGVREVERWITQPYMDRFGEAPGGDLAIRAAYLFTGDASLLRAMPDAGELVDKFMGEVVGQSVELSHLRGGQDEARLQGDIAARARLFAEILGRLRADAARHNAELERRIRALF